MDSITEYPIHMRFLKIPRKNPPIDENITSVFDYQSNIQIIP